MMFLYYEMRGTPLKPKAEGHFDSGFINPNVSPERPRSIYYIYATKTPGKPKDLKEAEETENADE